MRKISTGEDSTLKTWRNIAFTIDGFQDGKATKFIDSKIKESSNGENEEVIADERQLIGLLVKIAGL